jgi:hypothetical protein
MRHLYSILAVGTLALMLCAGALAEADLSPADAIISCGNGVPGGINCIPSKQDLKEARKAYARGLKREKERRFEEAFEKFDEASRLAPRDAQIFRRASWSSRSWSSSIPSAATRCLPTPGRNRRSPSFAAR